MGKYETEESNVGLYILTLFIIPIKLQFLILRNLYGTILWQTLDLRLVEMLQPLLTFLFT
jgi:hypothetical protein